MKRILTKIIIAWIISFSIIIVCENCNNSKIVEAKTTKNCYRNKNNEFETENRWKEILYRV